MMVENKYISQFKLSNILITNAVFHQDEKGYSQLTFDFSHHVDILESDKFKITLTAIIKDKTTEFLIDVTVTAWFENSFDKSIEETAKIEIFQRNALSIMFPYLRAQITLMSAQPNVQTIVLPAININAYFDDKNKTK